MNPELIQVLIKLADAHSRLADNVGRLADAFQTKPDSTPIPEWRYTFADDLIRVLDGVSNGTSDIAEAINNYSEPGKNEG